ERFARILNGARGGLQCFDSRRAALQKPLAFRGEAHLPGRAGKQARLQLFFQRLDVLAHRAGTDAQRFGGGREALPACGLNEGFDEAQINHPSFISIANK
ncbi:MAG: hypothetical protein AAFZ14_13575, partial [Pseudomonadota bacterium]